MAEISMSRAVADYILRQDMALLDEGIGPSTYDYDYSQPAPGQDETDTAIFLKAVDVIGQENIRNEDLLSVIQSMRGDGDLPSRDGSDVTPCDETGCGHPYNGHTLDHEGYADGPCLVPGCKCGDFV